MVAASPAPSSRGGGSICDDETAEGDVGASVSQFSSSGGKNTEVSSRWSDRATWRDALHDSPRYLRKMIRLPSGHYRRLSKGNRLPLYDIFFSCAVCRHAPRYTVIGVAAKPRSARVGWKRPPRKPVARTPSETSSQHSTTSSSPRNLGSTLSEGPLSAHGSTSPAASDSQARKKRRSVDSGATSTSRQSAGPYIPSPTAPSSKYFTSMKTRPANHPALSGLLAGSVHPMYPGTPTFPAEDVTLLHRSSFLPNRGPDERGKRQNWAPQHYPAPAWSVASQRDAGLLPLGELHGFAGFGGTPPYKYGSIDGGGGEIHAAEKVQAAGGAAGGAADERTRVGGGRPRGLAAVVRSGTGSTLQKKKVSRIDSRLPQRLWGRRYPSKGSSTLSRRSLVISSGGPGSAPPRPLSPLSPSGETPNLPTLTDTAPKKTRSLTNTSSSSTTTPVIPREPPELPAPSDHVGAPPTLRQLSAAKEEPSANEEDEGEEEEEAEQLSTPKPNKIVVEVGTLKGHLSDAALPPEGSVQMFVLCGSTTENLQQMLDHSRNKSPLVRLQFQPSGDFAASFGHVFCLPLEEPLPPGIRVTIACTRETSRMGGAGKRHFNWRLNDIGTIICPYSDLQKVQNGSWDVYPVRQNPAAKFNADHMNIEAKFSLLPASQGPPIPADTIVPFKHPPPSTHAKSLRLEPEHAAAIRCSASPWHLNSAAAADAAYSASAAAEERVCYGGEMLFFKQPQRSRLLQAVVSPAGIRRPSFSSYASSSISSLSASALSSTRIGSKQSSFISPPSFSSLFATHHRTAAGRTSPACCSPTLATGCVCLPAAAAADRAATSCSRQSRTGCNSSNSGSSSFSNVEAERGCSRTRGSGIHRSGSNSAAAPTYVQTTEHFLNAFKQEPAAASAGSSVSLSSMQSSPRRGCSRTKLFLGKTHASTVAAAVPVAAAAPVRGTGGHRTTAGAHMAATQTKAACTAAAGRERGRMVAGCQAIPGTPARPAAAGNAAVAETLANRKGVKSRGEGGCTSGRAAGLQRSPRVSRGEDRIDILRDAQGKRSVRDVAAAVATSDIAAGAVATGVSRQRAATLRWRTSEAEAEQRDAAAADTSGETHALLSVHPGLPTQRYAAAKTHAPAAVTTGHHRRGGAAAAAAAPPPHRRGKGGSAAALPCDTDTAAERHCRPCPAAGLARAAAGAAGGGAAAGASVVRAARTRAGGTAAEKAAAMRKEPTLVAASGIEEFSFAACTAAAEDIHGTTGGAAAAAEKEEEEEEGQVKGEETTGEAPAEALEILAGEEELNTAEEETTCAAVETAEELTVGAAALEAAHVEAADTEAEETAVIVETSDEPTRVEVDAAEEDPANVCAAAFEAAQVEAAEEGAVVVNAEEEATGEEAAEEVAEEEETAGEAADTAEDVDTGVAFEEAALGRVVSEEATKQAAAAEQPGEEEVNPAAEEALYVEDSKGSADVEDLVEQEIEQPPHAGVSHSKCHDSFYWEAAQQKPHEHGSSKNGAREGAVVIVQPAVTDLPKRSACYQKQPAARASAADARVLKENPFSYARSRAAPQKKLAHEEEAFTANRSSPVALEHRSSASTRRSSSTDCTSYSGKHSRGRTSRGSSSLLRRRVCADDASTHTFDSNTPSFNKCSPSVDSSSCRSSARGSTVLWPPSLPRPPQRQQQQQQGRKHLCKDAACGGGGNLSPFVAGPGKKTGNAFAHSTVGCAAYLAGGTSKTLAAVTRGNVQTSLAAPHTAPRKSTSTQDTRSADRKQNTSKLNSGTHMKHELRESAERQHRRRTTATAASTPVLSAAALLDMAATPHWQHPQQQQRIRQQREQHHVGEEQRQLRLRRRQEWLRLRQPQSHHHVHAEKQEQRDALERQQHRRHHLLPKFHSSGSSDGFAYAASSADSREILKQLRSTHTLPRRRDEGSGTCSSTLTAAVAAATAAIAAPLPPPPVPRY